MLVSSIARFNAFNTMSNAAFASMQASNSMMNAVNNSNAFGGDLNILNELDKKLSLDLLTNRLLYKISFLQEKMAHKQQNKSLDLLA